MTVRTPSLMSAVSLAVLFVFPQIGNAQTVQQFTISVNPTYPAPYSTAVVTVQSSLLDLSVSSLTAIVNGTQVYQGDVAPFSVQMGAPGTKTSISVVLNTNGKNYTQNFSIVPGSVAVIIEPQVTAPVLYPGKSTLPIAGNVRAVATTDFRTSTGAAIDPTTLGYTWSVDNTIIQNASGLGKTAILVAVPIQYRSRTISVLVKTKDGSQVASGSVSVSGNQPSLLVYQNDPLLGILFDHALTDSYTITGSEVSFFGVPYGFSTSGGGPSLSWDVGGAPSQTGSSLTLRPQGSGQGTAALSFSANNQNTFESAITNLTLSFGSSGSGGLFGL